MKKMFVSICMEMYTVSKTFYLLMCLFDRLLCGIPTIGSKYNPPPPTVAYLLFFKKLFKIFSSLENVSKMNKVVGIF